MEVVLTRQPSTAHGTFGVVQVTDAVRAWSSLELGWHGNRPQHSCIPVGTYRCGLAETGKWSPREDGKLYQVLDVPGRSLIKIHAATFAGDEEQGYYAELLGCIALGTRAGTLTPEGYTRPQACLLESRKALREFMDLLAGRDFMLRIRNETAEEAAA